MENNMIQTKSAGGVIINDEGKVLVVNQKGTSWSLPKGHIEDGEDNITTAKREIYEESGVKDLELVKELGVYQRYKISKDGSDDLTEFKTITMFLFKTSEKDTKPIDPENSEIIWVDKNEVESLLTHPKDKLFYKNIIKEI